MAPSMERVPVSWANVTPSLLDALMIPPLLPADTYRRYVPSGMRIEPGSTILPAKVKAGWGVSNSTPSTDVAR
jgi:hypothetical protein